MGRRNMLIDMLETSAESTVVLRGAYPVKDTIHTAHDYPRHNDIRMELTRALLPAFRARVLGSHGVKRT